MGVWGDSRCTSVMFRASGKDPAEYELLQCGHEFLRPGARL